MTDVPGIVEDDPPDQPESTYDELENLEPRVDVLRYFKGNSASPGVRKNKINVLSAAKRSFGVQAGRNGSKQLTNPMDIDREEEEVPERQGARHSLSADAGSRVIKKREGAVKSRPALKYGEAPPRKTWRKPVLTVQDIAAKPKSASFNSTRLALLCNPKGEFVKPLPSVALSARSGSKKHLSIEKSGKDALDSASADAAEHALMRLRLQIKDLETDASDKQSSLDEGPVTKPRPPKGRATHFPSSRSRSVQLSRNRSVKNTELIDAIPSICDPVIVVTESKPQPVDQTTQIYGAGSLPLEFSRRFGREGRRLQAKAEVHSKRVVPIIPGQAEGLMDLAGDIVTRVCSHLISLLSRSSEAARRHRDLLLQEEQMKATRAHKKLMHLPELLDIEDKEENSVVFATDGIVADAVNEVKNSHIISSKHDVKAPVVGKGGAVPLLNYTGNNVSIPTVADFVYKHKSVLVTKNTVKMAGKDKNDKKSFNKIDGDGIKKEKTASEDAFLNVIKQISCVPNHRSVEELCTVLLWLLAAGGSKTEDDVSDANGSIQSTPPFDQGKASDLLDAFTQYVSHAKECLLEVTKIQADRGPNNEKDSRLKWRSALSLRNWYCERERVVPLNSSHNKGMVGTEGTGSMVGRRAGIGFSERSQSSARVIQKNEFNSQSKNGIQRADTDAIGSQSHLSQYDAVSRTGSRTASQSGVSRARSAALSHQQPHAPKLFPKGPVSAGQIRRLGNTFQSKGEQEIDKGVTTGIAAVEVEEKVTVKVKVHIALDTFVAATGLKASPTVRPGKMPIEKRESGMVFSNETGVEDIYQEISKSLIPIAISAVESGQKNSEGNSPTTLDKGNDFGSTEGEGGEGSDGGSYNHSPRSPSGFSEMSRLTDHSDGYSDPRKGAVKGVKTLNVEADERERLFHKLAPPLNTRQRFLIITSILSDLARSLMLSISVLVKHTGAGHEITLKDLNVLFGPPCAAIIGQTALNDLLLWLKANRRSDVNFKLANQTHTELALQKLFAFWPQLAVSVVAEDEDLQPQYSNENLVSPSKSVNKNIDGVPTPGGNGSEKSRSPVKEEPDLKTPMNTNQRMSMVPAICTVRLIWPDRHSTNRLFRDPDSFNPNVNFI